MKGKAIKFPEKTADADKRRAAAMKVAEKKAAPKQQPIQRPDTPLAPTPEPQQQQGGGGIEQLLQNMM